MFAKCSVLAWSTHHNVKFHAMISLSTSVDYVSLLLLNQTTFAEAELHATLMPFKHDNRNCFESSKCTWAQIHKRSYDDHATILDPRYIIR